MSTLTLKEAAELEERTYNAMLLGSRRGSLEVVKEPATGRLGYALMVELDQLSERARRRYYAKEKAKGEALLEAAKSENVSELLSPLPAKPRPDMHSLTAAQRAQCALWRGIIDEWTDYVLPFHKQTTVKTAEFLEAYNKAHFGESHCPVNERTLRRKAQQYREFGEAGLADGRLQKATKGTNKISEVAWAIFLDWWLDESRPDAAHIYRILAEWAKLKAPDMLPLPSVSTFQRALANVPRPVIQYFRYGKKSYEDKCGEYILRFYEEMESNEVWSADYHTLDAFVKDDVTGDVFRPHVMAWIDVRSRKFLSIVLRKTADSDGAVIGYRKAVEAFGINERVYLDNGREFLVSDFGGRGRRKTDNSADYGTTILERMMVEMNNAKVANAKAKVIERAFGTLTRQFSKLIKTYTGGKPEQKPERLDAMIEKGEGIPLLSEVRAELEAYIFGWYNNQPSQAEGLEGKSPNECYAANLLKKRVASRDELDLMLLRSERLQTVGRNGVKLKISGMEVWFYSTELAQKYQGDKVYVRYNPEDLSKVRVYDENEKYVTDAEIVKRYGYEFGGEVTKEAIKEVEHRRKKSREEVIAYKERSRKAHNAPSAIEALREAALARMGAGDAEDGGVVVLEPVTFGGKSGAGKNSINGGERVVLDFEKMTENARQRREAAVAFGNE